MTTTDKTSQKLVASIRRTRKGAAASNIDTASTKSPTPRKTAARTDSAAKRRPTATGGDRYQASGRVWPD